MSFLPGYVYLGHSWTSLCPCVSLPDSELILFHCS